MSHIIVTTSGKGGWQNYCYSQFRHGLSSVGASSCFSRCRFWPENLDLLLIENRIVYTAAEVFGECLLEQALVKDKRQPRLVLLPAAQNRHKQAVSPDQMQQLVSALTKVYNYVVIDSPAELRTASKCDRCCERSHNCHYAGNCRCTWCWPGGRFAGSAWSSEFIWLLTGLDPRW